MCHQCHLDSYTPPAERLARWARSASDESLHPQDMEYEPSARQYHAAISMGNTMLVLAGDGGSSSVDSSVVERFNPTLTRSTWNQPHHLPNPALPDDYSHMGVTSDGAERLYTFGGYIGDRRCNLVYEIDMVSLECRELAPATSTTSPTAKSSPALVYANRRLVVYGGSIADMTPTDELFVFDLITSEAAMNYDVSFINLQIS